MNLVLIFPPMIAFFATFFATRWWIKKAKEINLVGRDINKISHPLVAECGGVPIIFGFIISILIYISIRTFILKTDNYAIPILATLVTVLIAALIGVVDDVLSWKKGLRQMTKLLLTFTLPIPFIVTNSGYSLMKLPLGIGYVELGLIYTFIIVPIVIISTTNLFNILGGLNGLESGMGIIILSVMAYCSYTANFSWVSMIALCMVACLVVFFMFNKFPAKIFPGDTMTYSVGALIGALAIIGSTEKILLLLFIPYFIEAAIKLKNRLKTECFGVPQEDGSLSSPDRIGSLTHIFMKTTNSEFGVVNTFLLIEIVIGLVIILT